MEAALFVVDLAALLLLTLWSVSRERLATRLQGLTVFDYRPGAECDDGAAPKRRFGPQA